MQRIYGSSGHSADRGIAGALDDILRYDFGTCNVKRILEPEVLACRKFW